MKERISRDEYLKKHGKVDPSLKTRKLLDIIKDIYRKINRSKPANVFPRHQTIKVLEGYQRAFELQKSKVVMRISKSQSHLI